MWFTKPLVFGLKKFLFASIFRIFFNLSKLYCVESLSNFSHYPFSSSSSSCSTVRDNVDKWALFGSRGESPHARIGDNESVDFFLQKPRSFNTETRSWWIEFWILAVCRLGKEGGKSHIYGFCNIASHQRVYFISNRLFAKILAKSYLHYIAVAPNRRFP